MSNTNRVQSPVVEDLRVFLTVIRKGSFAAAAEELGQSPAYVSKRIQTLETTLRTRLLHRTTRRIALTDAGLMAQRWALRILDDLDEFIGELSEARQAPRGALHICCTVGFGRNHMAPAVVALEQRYPELEVRLDVFDRVVDMVAEGFDLEIHVGDDVPGQHLCRKLLDNRRVLSATPDYLARRGVPSRLADLVTHECLVLRDRNNPFGLWSLWRDGREESVRVGGRLVSNNGEIVQHWALQGRGIMLRSTWDVQPLLERGTLVQVLPDYAQSANVWAVYPTRLSDSAKLRVCVEFFEAYFRAFTSP